MEALWAKLFTTLIGPVFRPILNIITTFFAPSLLWQRCFKTAAISCDFDVDLAMALATSPSLVRLKVNTFKPDRPVPSAIDFAVAITFELYENEEEEHALVKPPLENIRHFAVDIRRAWLSGIIRNSTLRTHFQSARDVHAAKFIVMDSSCLADEDRILGNRHELNKKYFESFSAPDSTEIVCVWLPDAEGVVQYNLETKAVVEVALNTSTGADRGFFRAGYDYSIKRSGDRLHVCFLDSKTNMEAGHFGQYSIGRATKYILWGR